MIDIIFKGIDDRQNVTHASGTIGGRWIFRDEYTEILHQEPIIPITLTSLCKNHITHKWVASYSLGWKVTIPAGCGSGNGLKLMSLVKERLTEVYGEG